MSKLLFLVVLLLIWGNVSSHGDDLEPTPWMTEHVENFKNMQFWADTVRGEVESSLNRTFGVWDLLDYCPAFDDQGDYYWMKIRTDDGGHVKIKTTQKEMGKPEKVHVEEYDRGTKAFEHEGEKHMAVEEKDRADQLSGMEREVSEIADFKKHFSRIQEVADHVRQDIEALLNRSFDIWKLMDYSFPMDSEKSYVRMKIETDDNGHVRVKTAEKEPGKPWDVKIEEYNRGNKAMSVEGDSETRDEAVGQGSGNQQGQQNDSQFPNFIGDEF